MCLSFWRGRGWRGRKTGLMVGQLLLSLPVECACVRAAEGLGLRDGEDGPLHNVASFRLALNSQGEEST